MGDISLTMYVRTWHIYVPEYVTLGNVAGFLLAN